MTHFAKFLIDSDGVTAVEYAVMLGLILLACVGMIAAVGTKTGTLFDDSETLMTTAGLGK